MHVLVTRPEEDGRRTAERLRALGFQVSLAPLIEIIPEPIAPSALSGAAAVVATSRNGFRSLLGSREARAIAIELPIFVVGSGTEALARKNGFATIVRGPGTATELAPVIAGKLTGTRGPVALLTGDVAAFDMAAALQAAGIDTLTIAAYRSQPTRSLPTAVADALTRGGIDAVMLMSPRTAKIWDTLTTGDLQSAKALTHACLSRQVADALANDSCRGKVLVSPQPDLDSMLQLMKRLADVSRSG